MQDGEWIQQGVLSYFPKSADDLNYSGWAYIAWLWEWFDSVLDEL